MAVETFTVVGMTCAHCVAAVSGELAKVDGVGKVDVDLTTGVVTLESITPIARDVVAAAVDDAGYELQP
ncbi:MAG: copper chaperone [Ilumatobacteraceae bacterium]|nr:copper chaperone [Ilumatobacteraceae bacterium]MCU1386846.1 copper chaperone [Ilumatobacteraceae bacterium]